MSRRAGSHRYLVLTPGMTGADGIAELSRLVVRALSPAGTEPVSATVDVLSLTDPPGFGANDRDGGAGIRFFGVAGGRARFVAAALRARMGCPRGADILCLHLHLSPVARLIAARRARLITLLAGIEAWRPLRRRERLALRRSDLLVSISAHTARRFLDANPDFEDRPVRVCHLAVRDRDGSILGLEPGGRAARPARGELYRDCAFFAMPSRDEGFGLVFLEAMREGKACIGGMGAAAEVIEDGVSGLVVPPDDRERLLEAVLRLFREPDTRARMGQAGAERVAREFTEAHFRVRFRALLGPASSRP